MANMSYCRFHNTRADLTDCVEAADDMVHGVEPALSESECGQAAELTTECVSMLDTLADFEGIAIEDFVNRCLADRDYAGEVWRRLKRHAERFDEDDDDDYDE